MGALGIGSCSRTQAVEEEFQKIGIVGKSPSGRPGHVLVLGRTKPQDLRAGGCGEDLLLN